MKEVQAKRYTGPFDRVPFTNFIQSPIGLVPKDKGKKTRLIFHLSYPKHKNTSVNAGIPKEKCSVKYPDFDLAVQMCLRAGRRCKMGKSDISMAFRNVPMLPQDFKWLVLKAEHPVTKKCYYFVDKCYPFGSSISCAHFQAISDAIAYIVSFRMLQQVLNYLDDYFFVALLTALCDGQVNTFLKVCELINFPLSIEKTFWSSTMMTFLGFLLDTQKQLVCIPVDKITKAIEMIQMFLLKKKSNSSSNSETYWVFEFFV